MRRVVSFYPMIFFILFQLSVLNEASATPPTPDELSLIKAGWHKVEGPTGTASRWVRLQPTYSDRQRDLENPLYVKVYDADTDAMKPYRVTHFMNRAYTDLGGINYDHEMIEAYPLHGSGTHRFGYLQGALFCGCEDDPQPVLFFENTPPAVISAGRDNMVTRYQDTAASKFPNSYLPVLAAGKALVGTSTNEIRIMTLDWLYDQRVYFAKDNIRYRALYSMTPAIGDGNSMIVGFETEPTGGQLQRFSSQSVTFEDRRDDYARFASLPVGTVIASMLEPKAFAEQVGDPGTFDVTKTRWILADDIGRVTGSKFDQLTNGHAIPDLRGVFIRGVNGTRSNESGDADGFGRNAGSYQRDAGGRYEDHYFGLGYGHNNSNGTPSWSQKLGRPVYKAEFRKQLRGGKEFRPRNIALFHYIKIN